MGQSIRKICQELIEERGKACIACDCGPKFSILNPEGVPVSQNSPSKNHTLYPASLALRLGCKPNPELHRPYNGESHETCRYRRHYLSRT